MKKNKQTLISFMAAAGVAVSSCGGSSKAPKSEIGLTDSVPEMVRNLTDAVVANDAKRFASMVSYPLARPYPLHDINDEKEMEAYYPKLVDDSLRRVIVSARDTSWSDLGWKGWTLENGQYVWVDETIYDIPYLSKTEREELNELERREMESLPRRFRKGWHPLGCMRSPSSGAVYRIDRNPKAYPGQDYRMMVWADSTHLKEEPVAVFTGRCQYEGTADVRTYFFASPNGAKAVYMGDINSADDRPRILFTDPDGINHADTVTSAYWLNLTDQEDNEKPVL